VSDHENVYLTVPEIAEEPLDSADHIAKALAAGKRPINKIYSSHMHSFDGTSGPFSVIAFTEARIRSHRNRPICEGDCGGTHSALQIRCVDLSYRPVSVSVSQFGSLAETCVGKAYVRMSGRQTHLVIDGSGMGLKPEFHA
jgi:hypothetical protein